MLAKKVWNFNEKLYEHFSGSMGPTNVSTSKTTINENGFRVKKKDDDEDYDENDAWGDVKKAKENIGVYKDNITGSVVEEKKLADYIRSPNRNERRKGSFDLDDGRDNSPSNSRPSRSFNAIED